MTTTFRATTATGIYNVLVAYATAHPEQLVRAYRARPVGFPDLPAAWVDARPEDVNHSAGVRTRTMSPSVVVVREATDNAEAAAALDVLVDGLLDAFTAVPQFMAVTIWSRVTISDEEIVVGDYLLPGVRFTFPDVTIAEGRV